MLFHRRNKFTIKNIYKNNLKLSFKPLHVELFK